MSTELYPKPISGNPDDLRRIIQRIVEIRERDVSDFSALPSKYMSGRKVGKIPLSSSDVSANDLAGDFNYDTNYLYLAVPNGSILVWRRITLGSW